MTGSRRWRRVFRSETLGGEESRTIGGRANEFDGGGFECRFHVKVDERLGDTIRSKRQTIIRAGGWRSMNIVGLAQNEIAQLLSETATAAIKKS